MSVIKLTVNGQSVEKDIPESRTLALFLREDLGLTGTKIGCEEAECGICTVLVNGVPVDSCLYPAFKAQGASITTIEGLAQGETLHPLQRAFVEHGAVQPLGYFYGVWPTGKRRFPCGSTRSLYTADAGAH